MENTYVTLVSSEGFRFVILKEVASISPVLKSSHEFEEGRTGIITLDMDAESLEVVVDYLHYNHKYKDQAESDGVPEFKIPTDLALELLVKADFLDI
ncbi:hypothetical protein JCM33374_g2544 [Metschnikowia sp. JCM 33374]|nr:hypothetical protein JCM33374_g2544 [Metschnikowia sp. JCM 33374]